jgi:hypothetical protein
MSPHERSGSSFSWPGTRHGFVVFMAWSKAWNLSLIASRLVSPPNGGSINHNMSHSPHLYGYAVAVAIAVVIGMGWQAGWRLKSPDQPQTTAPVSSVTGSGRAILAAPAPATPAASSCDVAREAFLNGTETDIINSMSGVLADKTAHDTARQFAKFYNGRDKANKSKQETDMKIVEFYCSL